MSYVSTNFASVLAMKVKDLINLIVNPTTYKFFGDYLGIVERLPWDYTTVRDHEGFGGVARKTMELGPVYIVTMGLGGIAWLLVLLGAALGAVKLIFDHAIAARLKWIVMTILAYGLLTPMVATPRSTHRSPVEFFIVLLFCYFLQRMIGPVPPATR